MGAKVSCPKDIQIPKPSREHAISSIAETLPLDIEEECVDLNVSFGYQCKESEATDVLIVESPDDPSSRCRRFAPSRSRSFSCFSGGALSANLTLANTTMCNGLIGIEILPSLDSPRAFRTLRSVSSSSDVSLVSTLSTSASSSTSSRQLCEGTRCTSAPQRIETATFLSSVDVQMAGGAAGEDRVQAVCSEENGWLFCGIYDGFNGRDAADYLASVMYQNIAFQFKLAEIEMRRKQVDLEPFETTGSLATSNPSMKIIIPEVIEDEESEGSSVFMNRVSHEQVLEVLRLAMARTDADFMEMVEQEMEDRPELAMVGSCLLVVLLHGQDLYTLNLGDSRAILATSIGPNSPKGALLSAVELTELHEIYNDSEKERVLAEHPDDSFTISGSRIKGKLKVTRAFGAGYLKSEKMNNSLMGILRVKDLFSPPYISSEPYVRAHKVTPEDSFVVLGSDGLFDFFSNDDVVSYVNGYLLEYPTGDPAKYMLEQLLLRAAESAGMTIDQLRSIPIGRRRKFHDDVTIIIIVLLGTEFRTSSASTIY